MIPFMDLFISSGSYLCSDAETRAYSIFPL